MHCVPAACFSRFVFMALMEYCLVNIVLGDSEEPRDRAPSIDARSTKEKFFQLASRMSLRSSSVTSVTDYQGDGDGGDDDDGDLYYYWLDFA